MNGEKRNISVPDGTRDILFGEAELYDRLGRSLSEVFERAGCRRIMTPAIEYYDVFDKSGQSLDEESMYKLTDLNGRLIVLRADSTTPAARVAATRLRGEVLPQKLYYCQSVYRVNSGYSGRRSEIFQSGVEMIGAPGVKGDLCCLTAALDALSSLGVPFKMEIGHVGFFNSLAEELEVGPDDIKRIRAYVDSKNAVSLNVMNRLESPGSRKKFDKIRRLPLLYGGGEVFAEAEALAGDNPGAEDALAYVKRLYGELTSAGWGEHILVDMGMVHKIDYYTGVLFAGYIEGAGEPVLRGGRYDNLIKNFGAELPATGFAVNLSAVADTLSKRSAESGEGERSGCLIHYGEGDFAAAEKLRRELNARGERCEYSCFETEDEALVYAAHRRMARAALVAGGKVRIVEL